MGDDASNHPDPVGVHKGGGVFKVPPLPRGMQPSRGCTMRGMDTARTPEVGGWRRPQRDAPTYKGLRLRSRRFGPHLESVGPQGPWGFKSPSRHSEVIHQQADVPLESPSLLLRFAARIQPQTRHNTAQLRVWANGFLCGSRHSSPWPSILDQVGREDRESTCPFRLPVSPSMRVAGNRILIRGELRVVVPSVELPQST